jgi:hypothetical protein
MRSRELPFLAGIAGLLRWLEELANIVAGPLLTVGLAIALIDLLTDGQLLASQPELLYGWRSRQPSAWMRSLSHRGTERARRCECGATGRYSVSSSRAVHWLPSGIWSPSSSRAPRHG